MAVYGQLNELRETIMNMAISNQDLLKFIYYCDTTDVLSQPNLTKTQRASLMNTQIFKYKRMPIVNQNESKCFLSMQYLGVNRNKKEPYWMMPYFEFNIVCADSIDEISEGSRLLAIEECLTNTFDMHNIGAVGNCRVLLSEPISIDNGYIGRKVQMAFVDWVERK